MKYAIGIDPGQSTGVGIWNMEKMEWDTIITTSTVEAEEIVKLYHENGGCMVVVEDARLRKWFGQTGTERHQGAGWAKAASKRWQDFLKYHKIPHRMQSPKNTKKDAITFRAITGWKGKTSEHARDAGMMVFKMSKSQMQMLCGLTS